MHLSRLAAVTGCCVSLLLHVGPSVADEKQKESKQVAAKDKNPQPKISVHKDVTYFTEPLDKDGYVDFAAALNDHYSKGVTPKNNAVVLVYQALGPKPENIPQPPEFFKLLGMKQPPAQGAYFKSMTDFYPRGKGFVDGVWQQFVKEQGKSSDRAWKAADFKIVASWIEVNQIPLRLIEQAVQRTKYFSPLTILHDDEEGKSYGLLGALLPGIQMSRSVSRVLVARAMLHLGEGRIQQSWKDLITIRKFARLVGQGPTLIEGLVANAIENMGHSAMLTFIEQTKPDVARVKKYLAELELIDKLYPPHRVNDKIKIGERAMFIDAVHLIARGKIDDRDLSDMTEGGFGGVLKRLAPNLVDWNIVLRQGNRTYDRLVKIMSLETFDARRVAIKKLETEIQKKAAAARNPFSVLKVLDPKNGQQFASQYTADVLIAMFLPALYQVKIAEDRTQQHRELLKIAFALSAHRADHGRFPNKLSELKAFLNPIPSDVFNGRELTYTATASTYLVYSVGRNQKDEKGRWHDDKPSGDDVNIRVPLKQNQ